MKRGATSLFDFFDGGAVDDALDSKETSRRGGSEEEVEVSADMLMQMLSLTSGNL